MKRLLLAALLAALAPALAHGQLIVNEANTVSADDYMALDGSKPYEGFDFGVMTHSGSAGNPFPADIDAGTPGNQTTLPNGWDGSTGFGRILGNGGDWLELVVTTDQLNIAGWTLYWENDDVNTTGGLPRDGEVGSHPDERGFIKFSNDPLWTNLRAGTIITLTESAFVNEISIGGDTGFDYDLGTDLSFEPITGDWHINVFADESLLDQGIATQYFEAYSDVKADNDAWRIAIFDSTNTTLADQVETNIARNLLDLSTGLVGGFIGESATGWGFNTGAGGVNSQEMTTYLGSPGLGGTSDNADYEDVDFSTFGSENLFNANFIESTLTGVQDFSALRAWLGLLGDYDDSGAVGQGDLALVLQFWGDAAIAGTGPDPLWINDFQITGPIIGQDELALVLQHWGDTAAIVAELSNISAATGLTEAQVLNLVPEPTSLALLALGGLILRRRR